MAPRQRSPAQPGPGRLFGRAAAGWAWQPGSHRVSQPPGKTARRETAEFIYTLDRVRASRRDGTLPCKVGWEDLCGRWETGPQLAGPSVRISCCVLKRPRECVRTKKKKKKDLPSSGGRGAAGTPGCRACSHPADMTPSVKRNDKEQRGGNKHAGKNTIKRTKKKAYNFLTRV